MTQNLIKTWNRDGFNVCLFDPRYSVNEGRYYLSYRFSDTRAKVVFTGDDFSPSPWHAIDTIQVIYSLLGFLTLRPGDTDADYFDGYTPEQLDWCKSARCEELRCYLPEDM